MPRMLIIVGLIAIICSGAACGDWGEEIVGGSCGYDYYPGTCTRTGEGVFSFEGIIDDQAVFYSDNELREPDSMEEGESVDCTLMWIDRGACTPCMLSLDHSVGGNVLGGCGREAFVGYSCMIRKCD